MLLANISSWEMDSNILSTSFYEGAIILLEGKLCDDWWGLACR